VTQWYDVKEFAIADADGYLIAIAEHVATGPTSV
jgi:hypothetical protein